MTSQVMTLGWLRERVNEIPLTDDTPIKVVTATGSVQNVGKVQFIPTVGAVAIQGVRSLAVWIAAPSRGGAAFQAARTV